MGEDEAKPRSDIREREHLFMEASAVEEPAAQVRINGFVWARGDPHVDLVVRSRDGFTSKAMNRLGDITNKAAFDAADATAAKTSVEGDPPWGKARLALMSYFRRDDEALLAAALTGFT